MEVGGGTRGSVDNPGEVPEKLVRVDCQGGTGVDPSVDEWPGCNEDKDPDGEWDGRWPGGDNVDLGGERGACSDESRWAWCEPPRDPALSRTGNGLGGGILADPRSSRDRLVAISSVLLRSNSCSPHKHSSSICATPPFRISLTYERDSSASRFLI